MPRPPPHPQEHSLHPCVCVLALRDSSFLGGWSPRPPFRSELPSVPHSRGTLAMWGNLVPQGKMVRRYVWKTIRGQFGSLKARMSQRGVEYSGDRTRGEGLHRGTRRPL